MGIRENIDIQYKKSIIEKKTKLTNALRLIKSAINDKDIAARNASSKDLIKDSDIFSLLQNLIKQRKDSIDSFEKANRKDLVDNEKFEIEVINSFLPEQKNNKETEEIIDQIINENELKNIKDMGKLMSILKANYAGQIDMSVAGKISKSKLSN